jgi:phosphoribosylanthranilate isomerase
VRPLLARVKICCIKSRRDVDLATGFGALNLGIGHAIDPERNGEELWALARSIEGRANSILVTAANTAAEVLRVASRLEPSGVQLTRKVTPDFVAELRAMMPTLEVVPVVYVEDETAIETARSFYDVSDYLLLDSGSADTGGGTGRAHDWQISKRIARESPSHVILAGGLTPANVASAISTVAPWGVDVCSGVRRNDRLDRDLVREFLAGCGELAPAARERLRSGGENNAR